MKVAELIEFLQEMDPNGEVYIAHQPEWPFEYSLAGAVQRADVPTRLGLDLCPACNDSNLVPLGDGSAKCYACNEVFEAEEPEYGEFTNGYGRKKLASDVILVDGTQLGYGDKAVWEAAQVNVW